MRRHILSAIGGAISTGILPPYIGVIDYRVIAAAAVVGGIGGACGVNVARIVKRRWALYKGKSAE